MRIAVYGAGYVGLVTAAGLSSLGHSVCCADIDASKINTLKAGQCPIHEKDLPDLLIQNQKKGQLCFTADLDEAIEFANIHFIAVGTPCTEAGEANISQVLSVCRKIVSGSQKDILLVIKSTVPVLTGQHIEQELQEQINIDQKKIKITLCSNPEFLREGTALADFLMAERIIGGGDQQAIACLKEIYQPLLEQGTPFLAMSRESAELAKYAANAMLAARISFINLISQMAEKTSANIDEIRAALASDSRIGPHFLQAGIGYGGSCFPKDVRALVHKSEQLAIDSALLMAIEKINCTQKNWILTQLKKHFHQLKGLSVGFWGLAFKPGTDDLREASSLYAIRQLLDEKVRICAFDPVAIPKARQELGGAAEIDWVDSMDGVFAKPIDALIIATEWPEFKKYPLSLLKKQLGSAILLDGRNCLDLEKARQANLHYYSVGRPPVLGVQEVREIRAHAH